MVYKRKGEIWGNVQCFNFFCKWDNQNGAFHISPRVMAHWYSPLWDLGTTKGHGFKPSGV